MRATPRAVRGGSQFAGSDAAGADRPVAGAAVGPQGTRHAVLIVGSGVGGIDAVEFGVEASGGAVPRLAGELVGAAERAAATDGAVVAAGLTGAEPGETVGADRPSELVLGGGRALEGGDDVGLLMLGEAKERFDFLGGAT